MIGLEPWLYSMRHARIQLYSLRDIRVDNYIYESIVTCINKNVNVGILTFITKKKFNAQVEMNMIIVVKSLGVFNI